MPKWYPLKLRKLNFSNQMNSLDELEKYFLPFHDPLEKCNRMLVDQILNEGIFIDITHLLHWSLTKSGTGGLDSNFILLNQTNDIGELFFNFNIYNLPIFHEVPYYWFDPNYHFRFLNNKKMSLKLQMRMAYQKILLFNDEKYNIQFFSGDMILNGSFNKEIPLPSETIVKNDNYYNYTTQTSFKKIKKNIKKHGLQIHIKQSHIGDLRNKYNHFCDFEKTLQECTLVAINTIKEEQYYLQNFDFYNNLFYEFKIFEKSKDIQEFYFKIFKLNQNNFNHFDFFTWLSFLINFSIMTENRDFSIKYKKNSEYITSKLKEKSKIQLTLLSYN